MQVYDLLKMELMAECLGKQPAFLVHERPWHAAQVYQQFYCSGILCVQNFWHWFGGQLRYEWSSPGLSRFPTLGIGNDF